MQRRAIKLWTEEELELADSLYWFDVDDKNLIVHTNRLGKVTEHDKTKNFTLLMTKIRRMTITTRAMEIFEDLHEHDEDLSLIRVQNACNILEVSYQIITKAGVKRILYGEKEEG